MCWRDELMPPSDIFRPRPRTSSLIAKRFLRGVGVDYDVPDWPGATAMALRLAEEDIEREYETMPFEELEDVVAGYANKDGLNDKEAYRFSRAKDILWGRLFPF